MFSSSGRWAPGVGQVRVVPALPSTAARGGATVHRDGGGAAAPSGGGEQGGRGVRA
jgi:hypothetical protein